jgi:rubrerythrin
MPFLIDRAALSSGRWIMKWRCIICGYIHEGEQPPYQCPICGAPAKMFERLSEGEPGSGEHP